jgi:hypothetical protein
VSTSTLYSLCLVLPTLLKNLWRYDYISVPSSCTISDDIQSSSCAFECVSADSAIVLLLYSSYVNSTVEGSDEAWTDFICNGDASKIFSGDHLESASPADPSFWVIHPTLERLFLAKLI